MTSVSRRVFSCVLVFLGWAVFASAGFYPAQASEFIDAYASPEDDQVVIKRHDGDELLFSVELAVTPKQQAKGLMNRTFLAENAGMLFLFNDEARRSFWMKDTLIPLDMLFIAKDGRIVHIHHMAQPLDEAFITSEKPAFAVLELNGGISDVFDIQVGDVVYHKAFRNSHMVAPVPLSVNPAPGPSLDSLLAE